MPVGHQLAQVAHAAAESAKLGDLPEGTCVVVLQAFNDPDMIELKYQLGAAGIEFVVIQEPDEPYCGEMTAIGVKPQPRTKKLKKLFQQFKLAK